MTIDTGQLVRATWSPGVNLGETSQLFSSLEIFCQSPGNRVMGSLLCHTNTYPSQRRNVQLAIIHQDSMNTRRTVPGQIVIKVFRTNRVLKFIRFSAPMLREDASVNNLLCNSMALNIRYSRKNIGNDSTMSTGTRIEDTSALSHSLDRTIVQVNS